LPIGIGNFLLQLWLGGYSRPEGANEDNRRQQDKCPVRYPEGVFVEEWEQCFEHLKGEAEDY
jgi:hypothetical protein